MVELWLASRSPRRKELLEEAGIPFRPLVVDVEEVIPEGAEPRSLVESLALQKARAGAERAARGWVLGADTVVTLGGRIMGKPESRADARRMLEALSGRTHQVLTGVALVEAGGEGCLVDAETTDVRMRVLSPEEIAAYVDSGEPDDKAGAYAIQGGAGRFVEEIRGSLTNVIGLPMELLKRLLAEIS